MLYPSIDNLLLKIDSKYSLVTVSASRAREMQATNDPGVLPSYESHKYVGKALEEIYAGKLVLDDHEV
ncbi:DNA-directed RNA polymerase subunit omega [Listeria kieliensis]|nr:MULTISPECIES: DNA-directed RNA polymerase subunit omega [Listeria]EUJ21343.1 DNA-directed RNA polymerase subunit omega [Listeria aquatica FSL S10-1188]EUJ33466.1 DNA-directed RNA polymerase subunit omega [Listeria floridensis FSL S10-1187]MBC1522081.1 DNA-directed RNA polymerase subunit omega [Listeria aquatica]